MSYQQRRKFFADASHYIWDSPYLFRVGADRVLRRCVSREEGREILRHCHEGLTGGHHGSSSTAREVLDSGFYWPSIFKDSHEFVRQCDACQRTGNISSRNEMPQNPIQMEKVLARYEVTHQLSTAYHPQTSGQVENQTEALNQFERKLSTRTERIAFKTPIGTTPFRMVYGKTCHLPVKLEHRAYWALRSVNLDLTQAAKNRYLQIRYLQIHEVEELRDEACARSWSYKERTKALHDRKLRKVKVFKFGDRVLIYNSRLKLFPGGIFARCAVELVDHEGRAWKVNDHRLKHYIGGPVDSVKEDVFLLDIPTLIA
ncbi:uncharacterized protein LOC143623114 [Bidens hawaiensis]|uniref:uncharacterized protein LOC143623114 n=1 Tax=Bidens hawaiensis TaxID=980011 RepID=UPI00404A2168